MRLHMERQILTEMSYAKEGRVQEQNRNLLAFVFAKTSVPDLVGNRNY